MIEFGLNFIAKKSEMNGEFTISAEKVRKFAGLSLLAAKGELELRNFRAAHKHYLDRMLLPE